MTSTKPSPLIYRDELLGVGYLGNAFTCESVHSLVHRLVVEPRGATFSGHRPADEAESEFLSSNDSWCRPVQVRTGPDGALWVVDMYRFVIEHPRWISPERLATLDVRAGADKGRIYRVVPEGRALRRVPRLDTLSTRDLAAALDNPNGTFRDTVHRLIVDRGGHDAAPVLVALAQSGSRPEVRAQALGALAGLGAIDSSILQHALRDPHPGVRRQAIRLSESWLGKHTGLGQAVLVLAGDTDAGVRFQVALSLGEWPADEAGRALAQIAVRDRADSWTLAAVLSSSGPHAATVLENVVGVAGSRDPSPSLIGPLIATLAGSQDRRAISRALEVIRGNSLENGSRDDSWRIGAAAELLDAAHDTTLAAEPAVRALIARARETAGDNSASPARRLAAFRLLGRVSADRACRLWCSRSNSIRRHRSRFSSPR